MALIYRGNVTEQDMTVLKKNYLPEQCFPAVEGWLMYKELGSTPSIHQKISKSDFPLVDIYVFNSFQSS